MILFSDFDNTIYYRKDVEKTNENIQAIKAWRANGNRFVVTTGRPPLFIQEQAIEIGLEYDYIIGSTGAVIVDSNLNPLYESFLAQSDVEGLKNYFSQLKNMKEFNFHMLHSYGPNIKEKPYQSIVFHDDSELLEKINHYINTGQQNPFNENLITQNIYCNFDSGVLAMLNNGESKAKAVRILINKLGMSSDQIYTVGDGNNDLDLVSEFENGFAVSNASEMLLSVKHKKCDTVASLIRKLI